ncbi:hypothetical protein BURPS305_5905 [Burkholderia pseudomallei 305]|nr:hypothetical protein BURPS305_5905 [Burkholderia pseudomallei 305]
MLPSTRRRRPQVSFCRFSSYFVVKLYGEHGLTNHPVDWYCVVFY